MKVQKGKDGRVLVTDFSPAQALKIAIKMEQDGMAFYKDLLDQVKDEEARREIGFLIAQEQEHLDTFAGLLKAQNEKADEVFRKTTSSLT